MPLPVMSLCGRGVLGPTERQNFSLWPILSWTSDPPPVVVVLWTEIPLDSIVIVTPGPCSVVKFLGLEEARPELLYCVGQ